MAKAKQPVLPLLTPANEKAPVFPQETEEKIRAVMADLLLAASGGSEEEEDEHETPRA